MQRDNTYSGLPAWTDLPLVLDLRQISAREFFLAGGKGTNLGILWSAGLPVPEGFCLTTAAYDAACGRSPISTLVDELSRGTLPGRSEAVRNAILGAPLPDAVAEAVERAYQGLGENTPVAVRSSATAEDLPAASFAGQQETCLNVIGLRDLSDAVRRCWASLWSDRAITYRGALSPGFMNVKLAVVVQRLVAARVSGVLFTANPLTGRRREAVLDASFGLGEAIVSGAVTPDHFVIDLARGEVTERRLGEKRLQVRPREGGGTESVISDAAQPFPCLSVEQLLSLSRLGTRVESLFGQPQDIEWALDESGQVWLTQARPITTLFPLPDGAPEHDGEVRVYYSINASQGMEVPFTPLGRSLLRLLISSVAAYFGFPPSDALAGPAFVHQAGGRMFIDVTMAFRNRIGRAILSAMTGSAEARASAAIRGLADDPRFSLLSGSPWPFVRKGLSFLLRSRIVFRIVRSVMSPKAARASAEALSARLKARARVPGETSAEDRLRLVEKLFSRKNIGPLLGIMPATALPATALLSLARRLLGPRATEGDFEEIQRGVPGNPTTEMNLALWAVARAVPAEARKSFCEEQPGVLARQFGEGALPAPVRDALVAFLGTYGHRCAVELDGGLPRWIEEPAPVFSILASFLRSIEAGHSADETFRQSMARAQERVDDLARRARQQGWFRGVLVRFSLERARSLLGFREMPRFLISLLLYLARGQLLRVGRELERDGFLDSASDIHFLSVAEIREALGGKEMRPVVSSRRQDQERDVRRKAPAVLLSDGTEPKEAGRAPRTDDKLLPGLAASGGIATGIARVVFDPATARIEPGEILVAPSTDPGWTPFFLAARALVMENGGPMAHGAIVAREYGIPAVVAVAEATARIRTGMRITVDGTNGSVTIL